MSQSVTLKLPDDLLSVARAEADRSARPLEVVLLDWLQRGGCEELQSLSDGELLRVCDSTMDSASQEQLSELQARDREGSLSAADRAALNRLMERYQSGLLRKAKAWKVAVGRGLRTLADAG